MWGSLSSQGGVIAAEFPGRTSGKACQLFSTGLIAGGLGRVERETACLSRTDARVQAGTGGGEPAGQRTSRRKGQSLRGVPSFPNLCLHCQMFVIGKNSENLPKAEGLLSLHCVSILAKDSRTATPQHIFVTFLRSLLIFLESIFVQI